MSIKDIPNTTTQIDAIPDCDYCKEHNAKVPAVVDGRTKAGYWAYMCTMHHGKHGVGIGLGYGQRLILREPTPEPEPVREPDDEGEGCPGHPDDDYSILAGMPAGETHYCDGSCQS